MSFTEIMEVAKNLGTPGLTIVSIAAVIIWLARQAVNLRKDLEQSKADSASFLLKIWSELEGKKPTSDDPKFEAVKAEVLRRFGVRLSGSPTSTGDVEAKSVAPRGTLSLRERLLFSAAGAFIAQIVKWSITAVFGRGFPSFGPSLYLIAFIGAIVFTVISVATVVFTLGKDADSRTYVVASFLAGLAIPYMVSAIFSAHVIDPL